MKTQITQVYYRPYTKKVLRRFYYLMLSPNRIGNGWADNAQRGWVSSRPVCSFEDAIIFVHDVDKCYRRLTVLDRSILLKLVIQEYTQAEAAVLVGISARAMSYKWLAALDRLTEELIKDGLLIANLH